MKPKTWKKVALGTVACAGAAILVSGVLIAGRAWAAGFFDGEIDLDELADVLNCDPSEVEDILDTIDPR